MAATFFQMVRLVSRDSLVSIATGFSLDGQGSISSSGKSVSLLHSAQDQLRGPLSLPSSGYMGE
jgi:hypothetical protein